MIRRSRVVVVVLASSLLAAGCGEDKPKMATSSRAAPKPAVTVEIESFKFVPSAVKLTAGGTVTWVNRDKAPHTAQNTGEKGPAQFDSGRLNTGQSKSVRFQKPGVYRYYCIYHRFMRGSVTVVN